jgi:hypothetical protein
MKRIIRLTESDLTRIIKLVINESEGINEIQKITNLKNEIEKILGYYYKNDDGKIIDKEINQEINPETLRRLGPYYKTKIESVLVGTKEDKKNIGAVESIKDGIINGPFKTFIGNYNEFGISKKQVDDYYTGIRCEYFRKGKDKTGKPLKGIENRPWCKL